MRIVVSAWRTAAFRWRPCVLRSWDYGHHRGLYLYAFGVVLTFENGYAEHA